MTGFTSTPPSRKSIGRSGFFQGGLMPAAPKDLAAFLLIDLRSLELTTDQGSALERNVREYIFAQLEEMKIDLSDRSAIDLSKSVFGIAID